MWKAPTNNPCVFFLGGAGFILAPHIFHIHLEGVRSRPSANGARPARERGVLDGRGMRGTRTSGSCTWAASVSWGLGGLLRVGRRPEAGGVDDENNRTHYLQLAQEFAQQQIHVGFTRCLGTSRDFGQNTLAM